MNSHASYQQLPVIDLSAADAGPGARAALHAGLHAAARDVGFFQLVGHGVPDGETRALLTAMRRFFALPEADRVALDNVTPRTSAATRGSATSAPAVPGTGGTSSTSARSGRSGSPGRASRRTGGCKGRTSGRPRCPS